MKKPRASLLNLKSGMKWDQSLVVGLNPDENSISVQDKHNETKNLTYDFLVVAPGVTLRFDKIPGSLDALEDSASPVGCIYSKKYAYKMSRLRENFSGGKAIFTLPTMPIKCGGAP